MHCIQSVLARDQCVFVQHVVECVLGVCKCKKNLHSSIMRVGKGKRADRGAGEDDTDECQ